MKFRRPGYLRNIGISVFIFILVPWIFVRVLLVPHYLSPPPLNGTFIEMALSHNGLQRSYQAYIPARLKPNPDLVFVLHGSISTGKDIRKQTAYEFDLLADHGDAIIVYPDGFEKHWNDCRKSGTYSANTQNLDDIGFLQAIEAALVDTYQLKINHVFATGLSNGGQLAFKLALQAPQWITGIAVIAANMPTPENSDCSSAGTAVAVMVLNGTRDPMNPYDGGEVKFYGLFGSRGTVLSADESIEYWKKLANYSGIKPDLIAFENKSPDDGSTVAAKFWNDYSQPPIALYKVKGGGHTIPHPHSKLPRLLGRTNEDINAPREIWWFFQQAKQE